MKPDFHDDDCDIEGFPIPEKTFTKKELMTAQVDFSVNTLEKITEHLKKNCPKDKASIAYIENYARGMKEAFEKVKWAL